ncbi:MAG TPA: hypothetical protein VG817_12445 [Gemmatimonadales bacterium]|nr:hypothetical protein [Gemmatimonadales bacterium]
MAPITRFHAIDLGTVSAATSAAASLMEYIDSPKGLRHKTGLRRAVIYGEGPTAPALTMGYLYLSDGALEAITELRLSFNTVGTITPDQIPPTAKLIFGTPQ